MTISCDVIAMFATVMPVAFATIVCYALTVSVLHWTGELSPQGILKLLGLWPIFITDIFIL